MKANLYSLSGEKKSDITLPLFFSVKPREDIALKFLEAQKFELIQPYSHAEEAGKRHSASGTISHQRHKWKAQYGKGISRAPRKKMWRRGTQFFWVGAEVASARGGRRAHGPALFRKLRKVNKKEAVIALASGLAATTDKNLVVKRYSSLNDLKINLPIVFESKFDNVKAKSFLSAIEKMLGNAFSLVVKNKEVRAGKGKTRGRPFKSNAGLLLIKGKDEKISLKAIDVVSVKELAITDLYPFGRLTVFTEKAIEELNKQIKLQ